MGEQLFIIGATGTAKPGLVAALMAVLAANGLQVRHASRRYQGDTTFETGGPHDLQLELGGVASTSEAATLETLLAEVREHRKEFQEAVSGKPAAAPKETKGRGKGKPAPVETLPVIEAPKANGSAQQEADSLTEGLAAAEPNAEPQSAEEPAAQTAADESQAETQTPEGSAAAEA